MRKYTANNVGSSGVISDLDQLPHKIPPEAWSWVENARMENGSAKYLLPWESRVVLDSGAGANLTAHALDYYTSPSGNQHLIAYCDDEILTVDSSSAITNVAKVGLSGSVYPANIWITDQFNTIPIATNNVDAPQCFTDPISVTPTTLSQDFPGWPSGATAKIVVAYKNFIIALNIVDTNSYPNMVFWSNAADPGAMPADWDYASTTSLSGRTVLGADSGAIVAAAVHRDSLYIYCEYATYRMDFVGGQFVMDFDQVFQNSGAFGPRCVGKFPGGHFVITKDDVIMHDGQQYTSVADARVREFLFSQTASEDINRVWVSPYLLKNEMLVGVCQCDVTDPALKQMNKAMVWQWDENVWSRRDMPNARHMRELPFVDSDEVDDSWDTGPDTTWDGGADIPWNAAGNLGDLLPMVVSEDGNIYYLDQGAQTANTVLRREDINLGGDDSRETAINIYPRMRGETQVSIKVGHSNTVEGPILWGRTVTFDPSTDYKVSCRATGRRHAIEFSGFGFELTGYDIAFEPAGRR